MGAPRPGSAVAARAGRGGHPEAPPLPGAPLPGAARRDRACPPPSPGKGKPEPTEEHPRHSADSPAGRARCLPPGSAGAAGVAEPWSPANLEGCRAPGGLSRERSPPGKAAAAAG